MFFRLTLRCFSLTIRLTLYDNYDAFGVDIFQSGSDRLDVLSKVVAQGPIYR